MAGGWYRPLAAYQAQSAEFTRAKILVAESARSNSHG